MSSKHWVFIQVVKSPAERKTRHILEKQNNKRKHPELPRSSRIIVCVPKRPDSAKNNKDNQLSQIAAQIMAFPNHVRSKGLSKNTLEA